MYLEISKKRSRGILSAKGTIVEVVILPVVLDCRELVDTHENGEPQKGLHLFYGDLRPLGELLTSHDFLSVPITFSHHQRHQLVSEEDLEDLSGGLWDGCCWTYW